mmetsp:Transcript_42261/g.40483  ORF Transcript_42261/g.40483 Transcript_42261/m.40483 type:complete len:305 (+) Transcript_42261:126-1040(+)
MKENLDYKDQLDQTSKKIERAKQNWEKVRKRLHLIRFMKITQKTADLSRKKSLKGDLFKEKEIILDYEDNTIPYYIVDPRSRWKELWDYMITLIYLPVLLIDTLNLGYAFNLSTYNRSLLMVIDCLFLIDTLVGLFTTFKKEDSSFKTYEKKLTKVIYGRLKFTLFIDWMASLPGLVTYEMKVYPSVLKLLRLLRVKDIIQAKNDFFERITQNMDRLKKEQKLRTYQLISFFVFTILMFHILTCLKLLTQHDVLSYNDISDLQAAYDTQDRSNYDLYVGSFYFNIVTISTCGYGNDPSTSPEYI